MSVLGNPLVHACGTTITYVPDNKPFMMLRSSVKFLIESSLYLWLQIKVLNVGFGYDVSVMISYCIVGFFEVLKFRKWLIFVFFTILFSQMGLLKAHTLQWVLGFFKGLNFTNDQHPQNSQNLRTSKKPTIW